MSLHPIKRVLAVVVTAVAATAFAVALTACGSSTTSKNASAPASPGSGASSSGSSTSAAAPSSQASAGGPGLSSLPADLQAAYASSGQTEAVSPYMGFKAKKKPPWTLAYVSTYSGNTWRASALDQVNKEFAKLKAAGLASKLIVTQSNDDVSLTSQQIRQALDQGADGILTIAPSATGINPAIDAAAARGVPVVSFTSPVTTLNAINTGVNEYLAGQSQGNYVAGQVGSGGKIVYIAGIPGFAASEMMKQGALDALKAKGVDVVADVPGVWTNAIAKTALLKALATYPGKLDYVLQQSGMAEGAIQALQQTGRGSVPVLVADDVAGAAYWRDHKSMTTKGFSEFPARDEARLAMDVLVRTLEGQGPKVTSILHAPVTFGYSDLSTLLPAGANTQNTEWIESLPESYYTSTLPEFFAHPADPMAYKP